MKRRPWSVIVVACFFVVAGAAGIVYHLPEWKAVPALGSREMWAVVVRLLAILCGIFMLLGKDWARWLAVVWLAYHVVLSAFHTRFELIFHAVLLVVFAYVLFRPAATGYFQSVQKEITSV